MLLAAEGLSAARWSNGPGDAYQAHRHGYDKVLVAEVIPGNDSALDAATT